MGSFVFQSTNIEGLCLIAPMFHCDQRGYFSKPFERDALDLRPGSGTFGTWQGFTLSAKNREMLYLPKGFAHGFLAREDNTVVHYLCGDRYDPESEDGILWNDRDLDIRWPLGPEETPLLSGRDQGFQTFQQFKQSLSREMGGNEIG